MTEHFRSPHEIERDIEEDRARLTDNLSTLQDQFSVEGMFETASEQFREHGGEIGRQLTRTVKENPAAVALTGIGLAWLIFGKGRQPKPDPYVPVYRDPQLQNRTPVSRPTADMVGSNIPAPAWARDEDDDGYVDVAKDKLGTARDNVTAFASDVSDKAASAHETAKYNASRAAQGAKSYAAGSADATREYAQGAADTARGYANNAAQTAGDLKDRASASAERLKHRLAQGTENMSEEARTRIIEARYAAWSAQQKAKAQMRKTSEGAADLYDRQPLVAGALAIAVGAALASALPRTRAEDEHLGPQSDALMERAERVFAEEKAKALEVAEAAKQEAMSAVKSVKDDLKNDASKEMDKVADRAKAAVADVKDAAKSKAKSTGLGESVK